MEFEKEILQLMKTEGKARGVAFQTDARYVLEKMGEEGFSKLEREAKKIDFPIDYKNIKTMSWYPFGLRIISLLLVKNTFGWEDEEIRDMGYTAPKTSIMVKLLMKFFVNFDKFSEKIPVFWEQNYTIGKLEVVKVDKKDKELIARLSDVNVNPIFFVYLEGYFEKMVQFIKKDAVCKIRKSSKRKPCQEMIIRW